MYCYIHYIISGKNRKYFLIVTKIFTLESNSLQAELVSSARPEDEVSDTELTAAMGSSAYRKAARTFKAIARSDRRGGHGSRWGHVSLS